jgi:hypothetical protein
MKPMTDEEARRLLEAVIHNSRLTPACLHPQVPLCLLENHLVALADRKALCVEQSGHALYDATIAARRHMRGEE